MATRETYTAMQFIDKVQDMRQKGMSDEDIAKELGFTVGANEKPDIGSFRRHLQIQLHERRIEQCKHVVALRDAGYSDDEIAMELGLTKSDVIMFMHWGYIKGFTNKGETHEKDER